MPTPTLLEIPDSLRHQLLAFRRRLWTLKLTEAIAGSIGVILFCALIAYLVDRLVDPVPAVRWLVWSGAACSLLLIPWTCYRWIWRQSQLEQLARLLTRQHPGIGDQLLGIIELSRNSSEQARSPALVKAAIQQVSTAAAQRDFRDSVPVPRHRQRLWAAGTLAVVSLGLFLATPLAAQNAWQRFLAPWSSAPRFTFAAIKSLPERLIVPHGEPFSIAVQLLPSTSWRPAHGEAQLNNLPVVKVPQSDGAYRFELPAQIVPGTLHVRIGDSTSLVHVEPMLRPELSLLEARIRLPDYLERDEPLSKDLRNGTLAAVKGSTATVTATISREISVASINGFQRPAVGTSFSMEPLDVLTSQEFSLSWKDAFGLTAQQPYRLSMQSHDDEAPSVVCENLPRQQVLLDTEVLTFQIRARDDFGVKQVGMVWQGLDESLPKPARGERLIGNGSSQTELLELKGTFSAHQFHIEPQPIGLRIFVEDYLPGRERVYSSQCVFHVLSAEQHAIWITAQLSRWHRASLEVRDRELQLHEANQALRELPPDALGQFETRKRIEAQAAAERANGRRLTGLVASGEEILKQAMRNPEIGVGHLEKWAEMMQILKEISGHRMPSVADLLKEATTAPVVASNPVDHRSAGKNLARMSDGESSGTKQKDPKPGLPTIRDVESSQNNSPPEDSQAPAPGKPKSPRLTLPTTTLAGAGNGTKKSATAEENVEEAVREQRDLLAEFDKIADELNTVLANMEGTTLVKRLKAAARRQQQVATKLGTIVPESFGVTARKGSAPDLTMGDLSGVEVRSSQDVSNIMDDMSAYFDRSRFQRFKVVLDDMREQDVTAALRNLGDDLRKENGLSIAQAEYWSETLDRWAEDLVDVSKCGACPGCKAKGSLPPSIVLEVLQVLEAEMNLREETRVAEQARTAIKLPEHQKEARRLSHSQDELRDRVDKVLVRIRELPDAEADFAKELHLLTQVSSIMREATDLLARPETGAPALAIETEIIELLLQSRRFNPKSGGGGGDSPGGGGTGTTQDSALALVGQGVNEKERREDQDTTQATGTAGTTFPEEFRAGLDEYFNRLDAPIR